MHVVGHPSMWTCEKCGRSFANRNQTHSCRPLGDVGRHFARSDPHVREIFDLIAAEARRLGSVEILAEKTRIALHARMSFAAFVPRAHRLDGHFVLARQVHSPRFSRVEVFSPRNVLHAFRLHDVAEVDDELLKWLGMAYEVGMQHHLR